MYEVIMVNVGTTNLVIGTWVDIEGVNDKEARQIHLCRRHTVHGQRITEL